MQSIMRGWPALSTSPATFLQAAKKTLALLLGLQIASPGGDLEPPSEGRSGLGHAPGSLERPTHSAVSRGVVELESDGLFWDSDERRPSAERS